MEWLEGNIREVGRPACNKTDVHGILCPKKLACRSQSTNTSDEVG